MTAALFDQLKAALHGTYTLEQELGGGGMSRVYVATDQELGRKIVVKVLPSDVGIELSAERFRREIRVTASLQHPHIVPVYAAGSAAGVLYYTMPYVVGQSLRERLDRDDPLSPAEVESIARDALQALAYAHRHGVVHRDIKPGNILLTEDGAMVTDFGIARATSVAAAGDSGGDRAEQLTMTGTSIGTLRYMAPEQLLADPAADHRMDLYALGLVLHECLAGTLPFEGMTETKLREALLTKPAPRLADWRPETPRALAQLVDRCLERDPDARPATADEALRMLGTSAPTVAASGVRSPWRRRAIVAATVVVGLVALGRWAAAGPLRLPLATARRIASRPAATLGPNRIIVAPFDATPDEEQLRTTGAIIADWISQGLSLLPNVDVLDARAVLINDEVVKRIPRVLREGDRAVALAREVGARVVITGHLYRIGDSLRANATIIDAQTGRIRQSLGDVVVGAGDVQALVERLRRRAAAAVAQASDTSISADFGVLSPPPSVEAYALMRRGLQQVLARDTFAIATLQRAADLDRTWIMPRLFLVTASTNDNRIAAADSAVAQVRALAEHASPVERAVLETHEANFRLDREAAFTAAETLLRLSPGSAEARLFAASQGLYLRRSRRVLEITGEMDPDRGVNLGSPFMWRYRAVASMQLGDFTAALNAADDGYNRFEALDLARLAMQSLVALRRTQQLDQAIERYSAGKSDRTERRAYLAEAAATASLREGDTATARRLARMHVSDGDLVRRAADTSRNAMQLRMALAAVLGDTAVLALSARQLGAHAATSPRERAWLRGLNAVLRRNPAERAQADSALLRFADRYDFGWIPYHRAETAAIAGERDAAVRLLAEARDKGYPIYNVEGFRPESEALFASLHGHEPFDRLIVFSPRSGNH
jgi:hypothetical protein